MVNKCNILMLSDRGIYNFRYRTSLISALSARGNKVEVSGVFDYRARLPLLALRLLFGRNNFVLSSNLKSNIFVSLFCRSRKVIILNGLGRFRPNLMIRAFVLRLLRLRKNTFVIVQNYADFRYLHRFAPGVQMEWVPGSGGVAKPIGDAGRVVVVQRDNKIASVAGDISTFLQQMKSYQTLVIVGCDDRDQLGRLFASLSYISTGFVEANDIFREGEVFLQPTGYGEGFPHTLADAIVSGMNVYISDIEFLRYGLGRLGASREAFSPGWSRLIVSEDLIMSIQADTIAARTVEICETFCHDQ